MMLDPKKDPREARRATPANMDPEPGGFPAMPPKLPVGEQAAVTQFPGPAKDSHPSTGAEAYRTVMRCRSKRESH